MMGDAKRKVAAAGDGFDETTPERLEAAALSVKLTAESMGSAVMVMTSLAAIAAAR